MNAAIDPSQLTKTTNCNSDYCTIETLSTGQAVKTVYNCGNWQGNGNYACDVGAKRKKIVKEAQPET